MLNKHCLQARNVRKPNLFDISQEDLSFLSLKNLNNQEKLILKC